MAYVWRQAVMERQVQAASVGLSYAGNEVVRWSKLITPVDTGRLRASIHIFFEDTYTVLIGAFTHYARFVELGTCKMAPRAYLRGALYVDMIREIVQSALKYARTT